MAKYTELFAEYLESGGTTIFTINSISDDLVTPL